MPLPETLTNSERKRVADLLWQTITNVEKGQTAYWTAAQLRHIAQEVEPPEYWPKDKPRNLEAA